ENSLSFISGEPCTKKDYQESKANLAQKKFIRNPRRTLHEKTLSGIQGEPCTKKDVQTLTIRNWDLYIL
ncbi:MAG: hypothetical protein DRR19_12690, partial [Candidatus Parabeggiatoa sp. nov. 1]